MYETFKHFATYPALPGTVSWEERKPAAATSLLTEELSKTRSCSEIGTPMHYCACLDYRTMTLDELGELGELPGHGSYASVIETTIGGLLKSQNEKKRRMEANGVNSTCQELELDRVTQIRVAEAINGIQGVPASDGGQETRQLDILYTVKGNSYAVFMVLFEMTAVVGVDDSSDLEQPLPATVTIRTHGMKSLYRHFAGCRDNRLEPNYCICVT